MITRPQYELITALQRARVRHLLVGAAGANYWAQDGSQAFSLPSHEFLVEPDPRALRAAWTALQQLGYTLRERTERIADALALGFAESVVREGRDTTGYRMRDRMLVEIHTAFRGATFDELWAARRTFRAGELELDVARLGHILDELWTRNRHYDHLIVSTWSQGMHDLLEPNPEIAVILAEHRARIRAGLVGKSD
jgi:hypothetical protein